MSHSHPHSIATSSRRLWYAIGLSIAFVVVEGFIGWRIGSLALVSDAGHNLTDALALVLSAFAIWIARKPATDARTFGYHRVAILTALVNALSLVGISVLIFVEAIRRLRTPEPVEGAWMVGTALAAFVMNVWISYWLHAGARHDLNLRSAYLHMVYDALASLGVVLAGVVVWTTGSTLADPIVSIVLGALVLWSAGGVLKESLDILMEAVPRGINLDAIERCIRSLPGVLGCHDLHVWTISSGYLAASCHVEVEEQLVSEGQRIARLVSEALAERHGITHTTVQVEAEECHNGDRLCTMRRLDVDVEGTPRAA